MDWEQRCIRVCAGVVIFAAALRLWTGGAMAPAARALSQPQTAAFLTYLQTGRVVRLSAPECAPTQPTIAVQSSAQPAEPVSAPLVFTEGDAELLSVEDTCGAKPDVKRLLEQPVELELTGEGPRVLILHSHTTESFTQTDQRYTETSPYRTLDEDYNMIALGQTVAQILEQAGIGVIHDTTLHDYPSYSGSYSHAAASTKAYLEQYPTIELILDLHRDAAETSSGQMATQCAIGGMRAAQLMFVLGTDTRLEHPQWEENLSLALKLQVLLERSAPGICRDLNLSKNRYNQHLGKYALLVEIGAAGNTLDEAKLAAQKLGEAIVELDRSE